MNPMLSIKLAVSFVAGFLFWFFVLLVMMVYAFMPVEKEPRSVIFMVVAPILYLAGTTLLFNKIFKNKGWKQSLTNLLLILSMAGVSLLVLDVIARVL